MAIDMAPVAGATVAVAGAPGLGRPYVLTDIYLIA